MNFDNMPELKLPWGYFAVLGFMGVVIATALWWFWAKRWISWGRRQMARVRPFTVPRDRLRGYFSHWAKQSYTNTDGK